MNRLTEQTYVTVSVDDVRLHPENPRQGDVAAIVGSIEANGFFGAIVVQRSTGHILAGNHRYLAAIESGLRELPAIMVDVDDDRARRILLADNRLAELARWSDDGLAALLGSLAETPESLGGTGFTEDDLIRLVTGSSAGDDADENDDDISDVPTEPVTRPGDIWRVGDHVVICGDIRDPHVAGRLLHGVTVAVSFTSPPYASQRVYDETSGFTPIPPAAYVDWFEPVQANVRSHLAADGSWFVNIKAESKGLDTELYVMDLVIAHARRWGWHFATEFCWERSGMPGRVDRRFKNQFEPIYQFTVGDWKFRPDAVRHPSDNVPIARGPGAGDTKWAHAQGRRNPFEDQDIEPGMAYPGNRLTTFARTHEMTGHPASFPVGLPAWFLRAYSDPGDAVFDPFLGSGSTILAAHLENRVGYGCEISPGYVDVALRRLQRHTGIMPERNGETHDFTP